MRKLKGFVCVIMCIICTLLPLYDCIDVRAANLPGLNSGLTDALVYYGLVQSGHMTIDGGGGHKFGKAVTEDNNSTLFDRLRTIISNALDNNDITVNNNKYVFNQTVTQNFYNEINGGTGVGGYQAILFDGNPTFNDFTVNGYTNGSFYNAVQSAYGNYQKYFVMAAQGYNSYYSNTRCTTVVIFDLSDVAYIYGSGSMMYGTYNFMNSNLTSQSVPYTIITQVCNTGTIQGVSVSTGSRVNTAISVGGTTLYDMYQYSHFPNSASAYYDRYTQNAGMYYDTNYPVIVGSSEAQARQAYLFSSNPTYITPKTYNIFPDLDQSTYNETNFKDCYNTYVNNVNNTYNENHVNDPDFNVQDFRDIANDQIRLISQSIAQGVGDITQVIETQTEKLNRIIDLLEEIKEILQDDSGGGGSLTAEEITQLLSDLAYIKNNVLTTSAFNSVMDDVQTALNAIQSVTSDNYNQLEDINDMLIDIYHAIVGQNTTTNNYYYGDNYYINNYHNNNNNMDDFIDDAQDSFDDSVIDAMKGVVPFVFIIMAGSLFEKLATDPEAPHFEIPFKIDSFGIDESIEIDLSNYGAIHDILDLGWCILLIAALMVVTFKALYLVASTFF